MNQEYTPNEQVRDITDKTQERELTPEDKRRIVGEFQNYVLVDHGSQG
jgi:hypothetical protein